MVFERAWRPRPGVWFSSAAGPKDGRSSHRNAERTAGATQQADAVTNTTDKNTNTSDAAGQRFPGKSRLRDAASYSRVFKNARRSRDKLFTVLTSDNGGSGARLGLAISKKYCRLAVGRNRLKRVVRESFREHQADLGGLDVVVLNQPGTERASNQALFASLARHWQRCGAAGTAAQDKTLNG